MSRSGVGIFVPHRSKPNSLFYTKKGKDSLSMPNERQEIAVKYIQYYAPLGIPRIVQNYS